MNRIIYIYIAESQESATYLNGVQIVSFDPECESFCQTYEVADKLATALEAVTIEKAISPENLPEDWNWRDAYLLAAEELI